ncbi:uncharacterized protein BJX67DRAFT_167455 [Aspergillus lucknowensis]|uniref:AB hydrolase-1 domain-containing protein n=1 Tax=Aspergillus lucknowensis TaxID=176173 RepID=A0ABR4M540_9EURO
MILRSVKSASRHRRPPIEAQPLVTIGLWLRGLALPWLRGRTPVRIIAGANDGGKDTRSSLWQLDFAHKGYKATTITLPSIGRPPSTTAYDDAEHIKQAPLGGLVARGKQIVLVMHSYASSLVKGFTHRDLAGQGRRGELSVLCT